MEPITTNIRVVIDRSSAGYRARFAIAYLALFVLMGGDAIRYAVGWLGWGIVLGVLLVAGVGATLCMHRYARTKQVATLAKGIPTPPTDSAVLVENKLAARAALSPPTHLAVPPAACV
jgi:hypothetical protein